MAERKWKFWDHAPPNDPDQPQPLHSMDDLARRDRQQNIELRNSYARGLLDLLGFQIIVSNVVFVVYATFGHGWEVPNSVINVWLGSVVVELVGVVTVITKHLFPPPKDD
jgi:hypothetical protein